MHELFWRHSPPCLLQEGGPSVPHGIMAALAMAKSTTVKVMAVGASEGKTRRAMPHSAVLTASSRSKEWRAAVGGQGMAEGRALKHVIALAVYQPVRPGTGRGGGEERAEIKKGLVERVVHRRSKMARAAVGQQMVCGIEGMDAGEMQELV